MRLLILKRFRSISELLQNTFNRFWKCPKPFRSMSMLLNTIRLISHLFQCAQRFVSFSMSIHSNSSAKANLRVAPSETLKKQVNSLSPFKYNSEKGCLLQRQVFINWCERRALRFAVACVLTFTICSEPNLRAVFCWKANCFTRIRLYGNLRGAPSEQLTQY